MIVQNTEKEGIHVLCITYMMSMHGITNICDYIFTKQNSSAKYHPAKNTAYTILYLPLCAVKDKSFVVQKF